MTLNDYRHYPYIEELQQRFDNENFADITEVEYGGKMFHLPQSFIKKLKHAGVPEQADSIALQKCYDRKARHVSDNPMDFWELTYLELEVLAYIIQALNSQNVISHLNEKYDQIFTQDFLRQKFDIDEQSEMALYFAKISPEPIPDDILCIALPGLDKTQLQNLADKIAYPHAHRCICIVHKNSLEIYGIFDDIANHLKRLGAKA